MLSLRKRSFSCGMKRKSPSSALYPSISSVCNELKKLKLDCEPFGVVGLPSSSKSRSRALSAGVTDMGNSKTFLDAASLLDSPLQENRDVSRQ